MTHVIEILFWIGTVNLAVLVQRLIRREKALRDTLEMERLFRTKWCSVCGVVYQLHPGAVPDSPPYTPACTGGHWEQ